MQHNRQGLWQKSGSLYFKHNSGRDNFVAPHIGFISVTRSGDLLDFGQLFKPLATINLPRFATFLGNVCKGVKIYHFLLKSFLGNFYRHLAIFFWSHWLLQIKAF